MKLLRYIFLKACFAFRTEYQQRWYRINLINLPKPSIRQVVSNIGFRVVFLKRVSLWNGILPSVGGLVLFWHPHGSTLCRLVANSYILKMTQYCSVDFKEKVCTLNSRHSAHFASVGIIEILCILLLFF